MWISDQRVFALVCWAVVFGVIICVVSAEKTHARPKYLGAFLKEYPGIAEAAKKRKCSVCHEGTDKKNRNGYGKAIAAHLGKSEKDAAKLVQALNKAVKLKADENKQTYGERIKAGLLPLE